ncbi:MAG: hypothetical protein LBB25_04510 [Holosporaceae bacterium]|jgi:hypothetical protein|nr:hypothetical protein [Holosporaceae bacterium]
MYKIGFLVTMVFLLNPIIVHDVYGMKTVEEDRVTSTTSLTQLQSTAETQALIQTLQSENLKLANHRDDLRQLVTDIILGLEDARDTNPEQSIKTLYDLLVIKIKEELQKTEAPYTK